MRLSKQEFKTLRRVGRFTQLQSGYAFVSKSITSDPHSVKYAFVIGAKTLPKAVDRNKVRRRLRAALYEITRDKEYNLAFFYVYKKSDILTYSNAKHEIELILHE